MELVGVNGQWGRWSRGQREEASACWPVMKNQALADPWGSLRDGVNLSRGPPGSMLSRSSCSQTPCQLGLLPS